MSMRLRFWGACGVLLTAVTAGGTQISDHPRVFVTEHPMDKTKLPCRPGTNFEGSYLVKGVTVEDPFKFLYSIGGKRNQVEAQLNEKLANQPFTFHGAEGALNIIENAQFAPQGKGSFAVNVEVVKIENCDPIAKTLDLVYGVYSTSPEQVIMGAVESQATAERAPQTTAGLDRTGSSFHLVPAGGYNRSYDIFGGGQLRYAPRSQGSHLLDAASLEGRGSATMYEVSANLRGSKALAHWIDYTAWLVNYAGYSVPAGMARLAQNNLSGQVDLQSRPFWGEAVFARFGGLFAGGNMQGNLLDTGTVPPKTVLSSGYGALKSYAGLSSRSSRNVLSISYGLELGSIGPYPQVSWIKQIGDVADEWWTPVGDHKPLEVESRLTFGAIQVPHAVPLAARFFAGNADHDFIPGDAWKIRDVPVIRAIPANRFYLTGQGAGGDQFADVNLTVSYPVKAYPIIPKELSRDREFNQILQGQIKSAASLEQTYYAWKDEHFALAMSKLPELKKQLETLKTAVTAAQTSKPNMLQSQFQDCIDNLDLAIFYVNDAQAAKDTSQYGGVSDLLPVHGDALGEVNKACAVELNQQLNDQGVATAAAAVDGSRQAILNDFNAIDQKAASKKSAADFAFVNRTLNTLLKELDIFSIGPVAVFDAVSIGPAKGGLGGTRIGPGGGMRVELASTATFTAGYAWNVNHKPGEGDGALFFDIGVRDLFH